MYDQKLIKIGRMTMLFAIIANFVPAIYVACDMARCRPDLFFFSSGFWWRPPMGFPGLCGPLPTSRHLEPQVPYIGWLAGSVGDIRLPAASMAQKVAGVEPGTHEGDVIGTIGTACSVFVSAGMITLFIIIGSWVVPSFRRL